MYYLLLFLTHGGARVDSMWLRAVREVEGIVDNT